MSTVDSLERIGAFLLLVAIAILYVVGFLRDAHEQRGETRE